MISGWVSCISVSYSRWMSSVAARLLARSGSRRFSATVSPWHSSTTSYTSAIAPPPRIPSIRYRPAISIVDFGSSPRASSGAKHAPQRPRVEHDGRDRPEDHLIAARDLDGLLGRRPSSVDRRPVLAARVRDEELVRVPELDVRVEFGHARVPEHDVLVERSADRDAISEDRVDVGAF